MYYYDEMNAKAVCLSNVKTVEMDISGTGAKSNPHDYTIRIEYFGGERAYLSYNQASTTAETALRNICITMGIKFE